MHKISITLQYTGLAVDINSLTKAIGDITTHGLQTMEFTSTELAKLIILIDEVRDIKDVPSEKIEEILKLSMRL